MSTGIAVNSDTTSKDSITSSSWMSILEISSANLAELGTEKPLLFCKGDKMSVRNLEVLYRAEAMDETMGLTGFPCLWCLIDPRMAGGVASVE